MERSTDPDAARSACQVKRYRKDQSHWRIQGGGGGGGGGKHTKKKSIFVGG